MKDFAVNMIDESTGKPGLYMYIGFTQRFSPDRSFIGCYGSAIVLVDQQKQYHFDYAFGHTPDWTFISEMNLKPIEKYNLGVLQLTRLGCDIVKHIKDFISQWN